MTHAHTNLIYLDDQDYERLASERKANEGRQTGGGPQ
jgi:hypothetical protein